MHQDIKFHSGCWMSHHFVFVRNNIVINSQEWYTMRNYASRRTQMTKHWHFSNLTAYFSRDSEERSRVTRHITTLLLAHSCSSPEPYNIVSYGKFWSLCLVHGNCGCCLKALLTGYLETVLCCISFTEWFCFHSGFLWVKITQLTSVTC